MKDRCVIVTGSSSGIGRAITERLLSLGAIVIGIARDHRKFIPDSNSYKTFELDLSDLGALPTSLTKIILEFPKLNGLITSAGYGQFNSLENFSADQIISYINTNLISHMVITRALLPHFKSKKMGDIIFIGSEAARLGNNKGSLYSAAKFGLRGFSQAIRQECSNKNVRVGLINPGMVRTSFFKDLSFCPGEDYTNAIEADDIAVATINILSARPGTVIDEINLSPQKKVIKFR